MSTGRTVTLLALLWLAGNALRLPILAVPPVIPLFRADLGMSETAVGIVSGLPPVLFALAAVPGSLLIARFGALQTLVAGLLFGAVATVLRSASPDALMLDLTTVAVAVGIAVMQVSLPPLVREWLPQRIPFATAVYTNGLLIGETLPVMLMLPVILPLVGGSWRIGLAIWAVPLTLIALVILALAPRKPRSTTQTAAPPRRWWPDWRNSTVWRIGLMFGSVNSMYFATNAFLPDYLHTLNRPDLVSTALTALNIGQLPASLLLLTIASRLERRIWPIIVSAVLCLTSYVGILSGDGFWIIAGCCLLGFAASSVFVLILSLPPRLSAPDDVHRVSAAIFTISYSCAVVMPVISGIVWDATHVPTIAFIPIALCSFVLAAIALTLDFHDHTVWHDAKAD
jgi:CP family cyanate transporter-like MFS transporter